MSDDPKTTLKPCPFCGGKAEYGRVVNEGSRDFDGQFICCDVPNCNVSTGLHFATTEDVKPLLAETWNRRTP